MRIETIQIEHINANGWNSNEMDDHIYRSLVESIRKHGVLQPILVRSDMTSVKGEKRWRAAKESDLTEHTCVVVEQIPFGNSSQHGDIVIIFLLLVGLFWES